MDQDLKIIRKKYGEEMAKFCRSYFPSLLEKKGLLSKLLLLNFEPNHSLYNDLVEQSKETEFKDYIYSLVDVENNNEVKATKTPKELLSEAGYDLYECHSEEDIQKFKKYYKKGEELCTFDGGRLERCHVFFAVKKDVDQIKREDYLKPQRQDKYGTSVISIQFTKDKSHTLSIKNRYNHSVNNPDSTFSNNLDNIIKGLTDAFATKYGLIQQHRNNGFDLSGYVKANDGKYYKYNYEIDNIYYCVDNVIIDNFEVKRYEKEKYIVLDYFIVDLVNKKIKVYDKNIDDSFIESMDKIKRIEIEKKGKEKELRIIADNQEDIRIVINELNQMEKLENPNIVTAEDNFLRYNKYLKEISLLNLEVAGDYFLQQNRYLKELKTLKLKEAGACFLSSNKSLKILNCPSLEIVKYDFLRSNEIIEEVYLPNLKIVGTSFLYYNQKLTILNLEKLERTETWFLQENQCLQELNVPKLKKAGVSFLSSNKSLKILNCPSLEIAEYDFLRSNEIIEKVYLPNLKIAWENFLQYNQNLTILNLPKLEEAGSWFLEKNKHLRELIVPKLRICYEDFLPCNEALKILNCLSLEIVGNNFLRDNNSIEEAYLPNAKEIYNNFLRQNRVLQKLYAPNLESVGVNFLFSNQNLIILYAPNLRKTGSFILYNHPEFNMDNYNNIVRR